MRCEYCKRQLVNGERTCPFCGAPVTSNEANLIFKLEEINRLNELTAKQAELDSLSKTISEKTSLLEEKEREISILENFKEVPIENKTASPNKENEEQNDPPKSGCGVFLFLLFIFIFAIVIAIVGLTNC